MTRPLPPPTRTSADYQVCTASGAVIYATPELDLALAEAERQAETFPGISVRLFETFERRSPAWPERQLQLVRGR